MRVEITATAQQRNFPNRDVASVTTIVDVMPRKRRGGSSGGDGVSSSSGATLLEVSIQRKVMVAAWVPPLPRVGLRLAAPSSL